MQNGETPSPLARLFLELKARHVLQTAAVYIVAGLGVLEFVDLVFGTYDVPESWQRRVIGFVLAGFPAALAAAWFLEWDGGRIRTRSERAGLPGMLFGTVAFGVITAPLVGAVALNVGSGGAGGTSRVAEPQLVMEIFEPAQWATEEPGVLAIEEGTSAIIHGVARYPRGIDRVLMDGERRMSFGLSDSARVASFTGFVDGEDEDGRVEVVILGADGRYASRTFPLRKTSAVEAGGADPEDTYAARRAEALARVAGGEAASGRRWAVVVGVGDYVSPYISDMPFAARDATAFYEFLRSPAAGGGLIPETMMLLLDEDATAARVRAALTTFLRAASHEDEVIVFIVAQGMSDPSRPEDLYLLAHDSRPEDLRATAISMAGLRTMISQAYGYTKLVLADIPFGAGRTGPNRINDALLDSVGTATGGFVAFTAAGSDQMSVAGTEFGGGHGIFTHFLLEGLRGSADENGDRIVSLGEMVAYTRDRVRRETRNAQVPSFSNTTYDNHWPVAVVLPSQDGPRPVPNRDR